MTCVDNINVPRESYRHRVGGYFLRLAKAVWIVRRPRAQKPKRPIVPNERMVELNSHLLRDIGILDSNVPRKYK